MGKRIIFTVTNDLRYDQRMLRICTTLSAAGYEVALVGRHLPSSIPLQPQPYQQIRLKHLFFTAGKLFYIEYNLRLLFFLLFQRFDAICSIDLDTSIPGILISKIKNKPHIFDAHELFTHTPEVERRKSIQKIWEAVQKFTFKHTNATFTVGPAIAQYFEERYKKPVAVVRNMPIKSGIIDSNNPPSPAWQSKINAIQGQRFILYQGALNEARGLEALIQAMSEIPAILVLAGEGDLSQTLRNLTQSLNLEHKVIFLGMVPPNELPQLTKQAYIGYNVSQNAGLSYYLSLNNKFFDYTKAHLPSLINPFPEYLALMKEFEVGLPTEPTLEDIVKQANHLFTDQLLYDEIKSNCKLASEKWTWENETPTLINIFQQTYQHNFH
ncbi:MAG: glycosyltransferase [Bacteroidetes bacterium]|nr:glycosyltransferase [Bacteroidota bacterium]